MRMKGSVTIEASFVLPLFLFVFVVSIQCLFYSHDKSVISAAAYESVAVASGRPELNEEEIEVYFQERVGGRTFLFGNILGKVEKVDNEVYLKCSGKKGLMQISLERSMKITAPEDYIRGIRKLGGNE